MNMEYRTISLGIFLLLMKNAIASSKNPCCSLLSVALTGSAQKYQSSRVGLYELKSTDKYQKLGGNNLIYKFENKSWFFGIDTHTSGIRSKETRECPEEIEQWKIWIRDEEWKDISANEVKVSCIEHHSVQSTEESAVLNGLKTDKKESQNILYTAEDGANVDCSRLRETNPNAVYPPHPRVALLGKTGVGKSTLGNQLLGCYRTDKKCRVFSMGHGRTSHTNSSFWAVGNYLGKGGCITVIDTPGASDSEGRDYEHVLHMVNFMKNELKSLDVFLLMFQGTQTRISMEITQQLKLYESIFTREFWKHVITEISFWKWDKNSVEERSEDQGMDDHKKHNDWKLHYKEKFNISEEIPTMFIDPVFPIFSKTKRHQRKVERQPEAVEKFALYTHTFWNLANGMHPFDCKARCSAPANYYSGAPWVKPSLSKGRENTAHSATCQVWKFGSFAAEHVVWKFNDTIIYEKNSTEVKTNPNWADKIKVTDVEDDRFLNIHFTLYDLNWETQGIYTCENDKNSLDNKIELTMIIDSSWSQWGSWGSCTKSCMMEGTDLGYKIRKRTCHPPQNGGTPCKESEAEEQESCLVPFCPIDHEVGEWSDWTDCSMPCGEGTSIRSRNCTEGLHGGTTCPELEERQSCNKKPCPECKVDEWSVWSKCSISCLDTFSSLGTRSRSRDYEELDPNIPVCQVDSMKEVDQCAGDGLGGKIMCPLDALWSRWSAWSSCSVTCGEGSQNRQRSCKSERFGGRTCSQLLGRSQEVQKCKGRFGPCPRDCKLSDWSSWSQCSPNCGWGFKHRSRSILEEPQFGGRECSTLNQKQSCSIRRCPPCNSYMKEWTAWTTCTGGQSHQKRRKSVDLAKQRSEFTGMDCSQVDDIVEERVCPVDCKWSSWGTWSQSSCSKTCGDGGTRQKTRTRRKLQERRGSGSTCQGASFENQREWCHLASCCNGEQWGDKCFHLIHYMKTWFDAKRYCNNKGGDLASIHSKEEENFLARKFKGYNHVWIGGSDDRSEGNWKWSDGSRWDHRDWASGEPNNALGGDPDCRRWGNECRENCIEWDAYSWNDVYCKRKHIFLCEY